MPFPVDGTMPRFMLVQDARRHALQERRDALEREVAEAELISRRQNEERMRLRKHGDHTAKPTEKHRDRSIVKNMGLTAIVDETADFVIEASAEMPKKRMMVLAYLVSPSGMKKGADIAQDENGSWLVRYTPREIGPHKLEVSVCRVEVEGSPFLIEVLPSSEHVDEFEPVTPIPFWERVGSAEQPTDAEVVVLSEVDTPAPAKASEPSRRASLQMLASEPGRRASLVAFTSVSDVVSGRDDVSVAQRSVSDEKKFDTVAEQGPAFTSVSDVLNARDDVSVARHSTSAAEQEALPAVIPGGGKATGSGLKEAHVGRSAQFTIALNEGNIADVAVKLFAIIPTGPDEQDIVLNRKGSLSFEAEFTPRRAGRHIIEVLVGDKHVRGSPFEVEVQRGAAVPAHCSVEGEALDFFAPFEEYLVSRRSADL